MYSFAIFPSWLFLWFYYKTLRTIKHFSQLSKQQQQPTKYDQMAKKRRTVSFSKMSVMADQWKGISLNLFFFTKMMVYFGIAKRDKEAFYFPFFPTGDSTLNTYRIFWPVSKKCSTTCPTPTYSASILKLVLKIKSG